jgi:hypothetical protein
LKNIDFSSDLWYNIIKRERKIPNTRKGIKMTVWIVMFEDEIMGAFKNKEDAYNLIVEDFTENNKPDKDSPDYQADKEWFDEALAHLKEEYENDPSFGCAGMWGAVEVPLN